MEGARIKSEIKRQELFRASILNSHAQAEEAQYVYRPDRIRKGTGDEFVTLAVIHLPTGERSTTYLSPAYLGRGIWNVVDFERGVVFHAGIGMDPKRYSFGESKNVYGYGQIRAIGSQLIASRIRVPAR